MLVPQTPLSHSEPRETFRWAVVCGRMGTSFPMRPKPDFAGLRYATPTSAIAFRPEFLNFRRGIHVGNLEDNERITRILKLGIESRYQQPFVTERWGRGVYWLWIGYLPRANREAKPLSNRVSFGCSKFFLSVDTDEGLFKCGLQVERGFLTA